MFNKVAKLRDISFQRDVIRTFRLILSLSPLLTVISILLIMAETASYFSSLYFFKQLINELSSKNINEDSIYHTLYKIGAFAVFYIIIRSTSAYTNETNTLLLTKKLDEKIYSKTIEIDLGCYENPDYFDTLKRAVEQSAHRPSAVLENINEILKNMVMGVGFISIIISVNWILLPCIIIMSLPGFLVKIYNNKKIYLWHIKRTALNRKTGYLKYIMTSDTTAKEIRVYGFGHLIKRMFFNLQEQLIQEQTKLKRKVTIVDAIVNIFISIGFVVSIGILSVNIVHGNNTVGDIALLLLAFLQTFNVMQNFTANFSGIYQNLLYVSSLFDLFNLEPSVEKNIHTPAGIKNDKKAAIEIEHLYFKYPHAKTPALKDISMVIPAGKITAIVGLNGSGKSTLIKLLTRLYQPDSGVIKYNGKDITNYQISDYRQLLSVVFQDFGKYNLTTGENIYLGDVNRVYDENEVHIAAVGSGADSFIQSFPNGYNTVMGRIFDDGQEVSIGQWQKLALARAFYRRSQFIIMDEATSAIDTLAEHELIASLRKAIGDRGVILISHRLSVVRHADYIYVLSEGALAEHGSHDSLVNLQGAYFEQFKNDLEYK